MNKNTTMYVKVLYLTICLTFVCGDQKTFPTGFSEKDFHVTTLKDPNFANDEEPPEKNQKEDCPEFSPEELKKMKLDYNSDGARVRYVSANAQAADKKEIKKAACLKKILAATESGEKRMKATFESPVKVENRTIDNGKNSTSKGKRRGNEYEFDTVEYYDDVDELAFENEVCPGLVDVVDLDIAEIRKYDVECEKLCEWSSLYDHGTWAETW